MFDFDTVKKLIVLCIIAVILIPRNHFIISKDIEIHGWTIAATLFVFCAFLIIYNWENVKNKFIYFADNNNKYKDKVIKDSRLMKENSNSDKEKANYAYAELTIKKETHKYFTGSKINDLVDEDKLSEEYAVRICSSTKKVKEELPVKRLLPNLEWGEFTELGFAKEKDKCCERKICAHVLSDFKGKPLAGSKLVMITEMEPCIYCYNALKEMQEKGIEIEILFNQMYFEIEGADSEKTPELRRLENTLGKLKSRVGKN